jgi:transposase
MKWSDEPYYAALDWAREHHDVVVLDRHGTIVEQLRFEHTEAGWQQLRQLTARYPNLPMAVETSHGTVVEHLFAAGVRVYPVNPKAAERYRDRHAPSGVKDDARDAWSLADALRVDGHTWQPLQPLDPLVAELRLLCRDEIALIEQRTALIAQLRQALHEYYPTALAAFDDWTKPSTWAFVVSFPTPHVLQSAGRRKWEKFLHTHRLWRNPDTTEQRLQHFAQATSFCGTPGTIAAKSLLAVSLARLLQTLETQLEAYRARIDQAFAQHPDHDLFGSLPGTGEKLAPRLLAELGDDRSRFPDAQSLQCYSGTAPVTIQSGKICYQQLRRACNLTLRHTIHLWADLSRKKCAWAEAYYQAHRAKGQSHAMALRCLGQRWLKILWKMWQTRTPYDEALHTRNQTTHGSWVLTFGGARKTA